MKQVKVIATDLDGTLFYPKRHFSMISKKNKHFLQRFISDGGKLVVVTSRGLPFMKKIPKYLGAPCDFICCNGALVSVDGKIEKKVPLQPQKFMSLVRELRAKYKPSLMLLNTSNRGTLMTRTLTSWVGAFLYWLYEAVQGVYREPTICSDHVFFDEIEKGNAYKMMFFVGATKTKKKFAEQLTKQLSEEYPDFAFSWVSQFIEVAPKGCTKAEGVAFYLAKLGIPNDNVIVVGDSGNDIPMFDAFHSGSYCMEHSPASVKTHAAHTIASVGDLEEVLYPSEDSKSRKEN